MTAKKAKKSEVPETITLTPELMKLPIAKQFLKEIEAVKEKAELESKLAPVVDAANKALEQDFTSFKQVVRYVAKLTGDSGVAVKRGLTDEQKDLLNSSLGLVLNFGASEIAPQANRAGLFYNDATCGCCQSHG